MNCLTPEHIIFVVSIAIDIQNMILQFLLGNCVIILVHCRREEGKRRHVV